MSGVTLSLGNDFIEPGAACTKPIKPKKQEPGQSGPHVLRFEGDEENDGAGKPAVARVTLNDCLACSGCVTSAETVLVAQQSVAEFLRAVGSGEHALVLLSMSAAARAAIAVHCGLGLRETFGRLSGFFKGVGCHAVFDTGLATDLCLLQTGAEFVQRFRVAAAAGAAAGAVAAPLPLLTSTCPGWVCYAEKVVGDGVLPLLSRVKSPQQIAGALLKRTHAAAAGLPPHRVYHVALMPCYDKKLEASRPEFVSGGAEAAAAAAEAAAAGGGGGGAAAAAAEAGGARDVDCVISSAEVLTLLDERQVALADVAAAPPDADPPLSGLSLGGGGDASGSGGPLLTYAAAGASGGHADFVFRHAARELFGVDLGDGPLGWTTARNRDLREVTLEVEGTVVLRFAQAYGFRNIQNVVRRAKAGRCAYHFVEIMACPGGCANGGAQPRPPPAEAPGRAARVEALLVSPDEAVRRAPIANPHIAALYAEGGALEGGPGGDAARRLLVTEEFKAVDDSAMNPLGIKW